MANVFDAQIKAAANIGPLQKMVAGLREIVAAAKGVTKTSAEGARSVARAGKESAHAIEVSSHAAEAAHLRYFRSLSAHVHLLRGHFGELHASIGEVGRSITEFLPMLGALGAGASLVGLFEMTKDAAEATIAFDALRIKLGISARDLIGLNWAAKESGVSTEALAGGLEKFNKTLGLAAAGKSKDVVALFKHLRIEMKDGHGHIKTTAELLPELAEAFKKTADPAMRALMVTMLFGKAGQELLPILMQGRDALEEMSEAGRKFAYIATPEQIASLKEFGHNWEQLEASVGGFKREVAANLAPIFAPIIADVRDWILANRDWIATEIADKVRLLATEIKKLDLKEIIHQFTEWSKSALKLIQDHGGLKTVIGALILLMGSPLITAASGVVLAFTAIGQAVVAMTVFMLANPLILFATLAVAAAVAIYENWDTVKVWFAEFKDWIASLPWGQVLHDSLLPFTALPQLIMDNWEPIKAFFASLWDNVASVFDSAWAKIKPIVDALKAAGEWVRGSWVGRQLAGPAVTGLGPRASIMRSPTNMPTFDDDGMGGLYRDGGPALQNLQGKGEVKVKVDISNLPPGSKVSTSGTGIASAPETDVGYANPMAYGY